LPSFHLVDAQLLEALAQFLHLQRGIYIYRPCWLLIPLAMHFEFDCVGHLYQAIGAFAQSPDRFDVLIILREKVCLGLHRLLQRPHDLQSDLKFVSRGARPIHSDFL
jgi:hypothetical protein